MPCNSDYLNPDQIEVELQRTAKLYAYALRATGAPVPPEVVGASNSIYGGADYVPALCALINGLPPAERTALIYNARDRTARDLANWWEDHQAADKKRTAEEAAAIKREKLRKAALAKLTPAERKAIKGD